ncbi:MAG: pantoate--beta-alanine ligase [Bacteroidetes bacterium]|nr:pantoate--beta-alanine ligase [Bacteroidota bacterium]
MIVFKKASDLKKHLEAIGKKHNKIGFAPTMGALHQGHLSLLAESKKATGITVCSIFVNPTQFNDPRDFQKYPITIEKDIYLLEKNDVDILFLPSVPEIYPNGTTNLEHYNLGYLENILEGQYRPGHFQGVCQVMRRLLEIVEPDHLFMGQKDYQQCMVVKKLLEIMESKIIFHRSPTLREDDGLAMSSRNVRLNEEERKNAIAIFKALTFIQKNIHTGSLMNNITEAKNILLKSDFKIDYVEIANAETLQILQQWDGKQNLVALVAAFQGQVRLIDNMLLRES